jgi:hypothetical protein
LLARAHGHMLESHQLRYSRARVAASVRETRLELAHPAQ